MSSTDMERVARRIVSLEKRHDALARARQLAASSVVLADGTSQSVADGVSAGADAAVGVGRLDGQVYDLDGVTDAEVEHSTVVPDWIDSAAGQGGTAWDSAQQATDLARDGKTVADQAAADVLTAAITANDALEKASRAVVSTLDEYAVSESSSVPPTSGWSPDTPDWVDGLFVWRRTVSTRADESVEIGNPAVMAGSSGEDAVLLRVSSSRGTSFKNSEISTVLTVTVFKGATQIVNIAGLWAELGPTAFLEWWWRRLDDTDFGVISSADSRLSQAGFAFTISPADVDEQTVFQCVLHT